MLRGLVVAATLFAALPQSEGTIYHVTTKTDSSTGKCPGPNCNLRAAWKAAGPGDSILLPKGRILMNSPLTSVPGEEAPNGTISLMGDKDGSTSIGQATGNTDPFMMLNSWKYATKNRQYISLQLESITFSKFMLPKDEGFASVICLSSDIYYCIPSPAPVRKPKPGPHVAVAPSPREMVGNYPEPMLKLTKCHFLDNTWTSDNTASLVYMISLESEVTPSVVDSCTFNGNTAKGSTGIGMALSNQVEASNYYGGSAPLTIRNSQFVGNHWDTHLKGKGGFGTGQIGDIVNVQGPVNVSDSLFVGNTLGGSRSVITSFINLVRGNIAFHVTISGSAFEDNKPNADEALASNVGTIAGGWIHLNNVVMRLPIDHRLPQIATNSPNDQYLSNCSLCSSSRQAGRSVGLTGYQIWNRDPLCTNLNNHTASQGFAGCASSKPWLPCPKKTVCSDIMNDKDLVGYSCKA